MAPDLVSFEEMQSAEYRKNAVIADMEMDKIRAFEQLIDRLVETMLARGTVRKVESDTEGCVGCLRRSLDVAGRSSR